MAEQDINSKLGLITPERLDKLSTEKQSYLIDRLILKPSINILVGHSGLGKSPFCMQLGMCVAGGAPFLGHRVEDPGLVVYCDAESTVKMMQPMQVALAEHLGMDDRPKEFTLWNPNWNVNNDTIVVAQNKVQLYDIVRRTRPKLVIIDSLRNFYPLAVKEQEEAAKMIKEMRILGGTTQTSFLLVHHLRKTNKEEVAAGNRATVRGNVRAWLEEASGTFALINHTDLRLGWEEAEAGVEDDFWCAGFVRVIGEVGPFKLARAYDENGDPIGYNLYPPLEQLTRAERDIFAQLPWDDWSFAYITKDLGRGQGTAARFVRKSMSLGLIRIARKEMNNNGGRPRKIYRKTSPDEVREE